MENKMSRNVTKGGKCMERSRNAIEREYMRKIVIAGEIWEKLNGWGKWKKISKFITKRERGKSKKSRKSFWIKGAGIKNGILVKLSFFFVFNPSAL